MGVAFPYELRWAREDEWHHATSLVWKTFLRFEGCDYTIEGINNFHSFLIDNELYVSFLKGKYQMMVALDNNTIIGVASIRGGNHLSLLFVDETYHKKGVGRALIHALCKYLKEEAGERFMSVNAAPYAVKFYRKLGFSVIRPEEEYSGVLVTLMQKNF